MIERHVEPVVPFEFLAGRALPNPEHSVSLAILGDNGTRPLPVERELAAAADAGLVAIEESLLLPHVEHPTEFIDIVLGRIEEIAR